MEQRFQRGIGSAVQRQPNRVALGGGVVAMLLLGFGPVCSLRAENWPHWRGPRMTGVSQEKNLPTRWSLTENVAWQLPLPGPAGSTPVVWDDRIYLTTAADNELFLCCVSTEGEQLWQRRLGGVNRSIRGDEGNLASPSPCTNGRNVWALVGDGALACFDRHGEPIWTVDLTSRYGALQLQFGYASTPVLDQGRLYLQWIHGDRDAATREARVICLDAATGAELWQQMRPSDAHEECEHSYASPTLYRDDQAAFLITHGADYVIGHALDDGRELWRCGGMNPPGNYHPTLRFVASPAVGDQLIVVPTAKGGPVLGLRPHGQGDITDSSTYVAWKYPDSTPDVPSPLIHDGLVYLCRENGNLLCLDANSAEEVYHERTVRDRHRASPVLADGLLYLTSRGGVVTVVRAGREFEIVAQNDVEEEIASSPVISDGTIYLRTFESLLAIRELDR